MGTQYQFTVVKMKLIVLIALIGLAAAIPNPYPEEEYGPANGLRIPDYQPYVPKEKYGPTNGLRIPDYHPYVEKEKYGPTNGLRIPDHYHPRCYGGRRYRRRSCIRRRRRGCYGRRSYAKG